MKKSRVIIFLLLFSLMFTMNIFNVYSYDKTILPYYIKVGLFFGKTARSALPLESNTTFRVGIFSGDEFISLFDLNENRILLKKDEFYIDKKSNFDGYVGIANRFDNLSDTQGAYHIQIGQGFTDYIKACNFLNSINIKGVQTYLCYEGDWRIYAGPYINGFDAGEEAQNIIASYRCETGVVKPSGTRVQVTDEKDNVIFMYDSSYEIYFAGRDNGKDIPLVNIESAGYRGGITAKRLPDSDMTIINKLPLEEYLYGVIPAEMPASWPKEALKAQAIAARGFAITNFNKNKQFDFNLCTTTDSQVYKGYGGEHSNTNMAVDETRNIVITCDGKLIAPYYHSDSGGCTEDSENIWLNRLSYIRGIKDDFSSDTPYSTWSVSFTKQEIKDCLADNNIFIGDILNIETASVSDNGRVLSLVIHGTAGKTTLKKEESRLVFGLKSNQFTVDSDNGDNDDVSGNNDYTELAVLSGTSFKPLRVNLNNKYIINNNGIYKIKNTGEILIYSGKQYKSVSRGESIRRPNIIPPNVFIFDGKGYGHGLGMSQYGARKMAELGYKYDEILTYYYTGVEVEDFGNKGF
jgi:stage II sporulation protein D